MRSSALGKCQIVALSAIAFVASSLAVAAGPNSIQLSTSGSHFAPTVVPNTPRGSIDFTLDDGSAEDNIGLTGGGEFVWFNQFTANPADLPFNLNTVEIFFSTTGAINVGDALDIYVYTDADGDPTNGATFVGSAIGVSVQALDAFSSYTLTPAIPITAAGDILIAVVNRGMLADGQFPAAIDTTASQGRSWVGLYAASPTNPPVIPAETMGTIDSFGFAGNWLIRASGTPAGGPAPVARELPTLSQWGLMLGAAGLALLGLFGVRRRATR